MALGTGVTPSVVTRPEKIVCVGFNYRKHAEGTNTPVPKAPPLFAKYNNALNHHNGRIKLPTEADSWFDYETELVIVFAKVCKNVSEADALDYVAGYATGNDFSARGLQNITSQFTAGKTADGFAPIGPWLASPRRVPDPNKLKIKTLVNGEVRQDWTTEHGVVEVPAPSSGPVRRLTGRPLRSQPVGPGADGRGTDQAANRANCHGCRRQFPLW